MMTIRETRREQTANLWQQVRPCHYLLNLFELILFPRTTFEEKRTTILQARVWQDRFIARQEVPFECWAYDHYEKLDTCLETSKARGWAVISFVEGGVRTGIEAVAYLITKLAEATIYKPEHTSARRLVVLKVQWTGVRLSAYALWSPKAAVIRAHQRAGKEILATGLNFPWGSDYPGYPSRRRYFLPIESSGYPWPGSVRSL